MTAEHNDDTPAVRTTRRGTARRKLILDKALFLFGQRGFYTVSMNDIGTAAGITGPGIYRHFEGKNEILVALLDRASEELLECQQLVDTADSSEDALLALVAFGIDYALNNAAAIALYMELGSRLPDRAGRAIRRRQRLYIETWVAVLAERQPDRTNDELHVAVHGAIGLLNSTVYYESGLNRDDLKACLKRMVLNTLMHPAEAAAYEPAS